MCSKISKKRVLNKNQSKKRLETPSWTTSQRTTSNQKDILRPHRNGYFIWGRHAVYAALKNEKRRILQIYITSDTVERSLNEFLAELNPNRRKRLPAVKNIDASTLETIEKKYDKALHQGLVLSVLPMELPTFEDLIASISDDSVTLILLDQLSDPRNVGAILRSAEAFGVSAVITTFRNAADEGGVLTRAASGSFENVPYIKVTNLVRTIKKLQACDFNVIGLSGEGIKPVAELSKFKRLAIVMGAEGHGLRRLTRERCDEIVRIDIDPKSDSLNVSNAAAIALYASSLSNPSHLKR